MSLEESLNEPLERELLKAFNPLKDIERYDVILKRRVIQNFMDSLGRLFFDYFQFHKEKALVDVSLLQVVKKHIQEIYIFDLRYLIYLIEYPGEWDKVCLQRSRLEAFNEMFGSAVGLLNLDEVEEEMQGVKHNFSVNKNLVPNNVPSSHWWWFHSFWEEQ